MGQGTDQMHLLLQGFVAVYQIVFIYFTFPGANNFLRFAKDLLHGVHYIKASSETQGQRVGVRESLNGRKNMA